MRNQAQTWPILLLGIALLAALPGPAAAEVSTTNVSAQEPALDFASLTKAACHGNVSCQPYYPSCASWSGYSNCDDPFCGVGPKCGGYYCDDYYFCWWEPGPALKQRRERFRVCFDQYGNSCTEWQQTLTSTCDENCWW